MIPLAEPQRQTAIFTHHNPASTVRTIDGRHRGSRVTSAFATGLSSCEYWKGESVSLRAMRASVVTLLMTVGRGGCQPETLLRALRRVLGEVAILHWQVRRSENIIYLPVVDSEISVARLIQFSWSLPLWFSCLVCHAHLTFTKDHPSTSQALSYHALRQNPPVAEGTWPTPSNSLALFTRPNLKASSHRKSNSSIFTLPSIQI